MRGRKSNGGAARRGWWLFAPALFAACFLADATIARAFGLTECPASRYGDDLGCTAGDVSVTGIRAIGDVTSCTGGSFITLDLELTVNFASPDRYDIGIFISKDGKDPRLRVTSGGAASCSVAILPVASPFLNLDSNGGADTCGDGNNSISGGTGSGLLYMPRVTVPCQSISGGGGQLYIPFVVSWDNQASPTGSICSSIADPVPNTKSKCNAPTIAQGSVSVIVLPTITNTDGITFLKSGDSTTYTVVITNTTGVTLSGAVFQDPAVNNINVSGVTCTASGGAVCPLAITIDGMQGAGLTLPAMPVNGRLTFAIDATLAGRPPDRLTNTATVTVAGQTGSASDTDYVVGALAIIPPSLSQYGSPSTLMTYNYAVHNFSAGSDTISLSATSSNGWTVQFSASSVTVPSGGSVNVTVTVQIPAGAAPGTLDVTTITARSGTDPTQTATASANTTVVVPLTITPDNNGAGGKGASVFYKHRVQNNTASSRTIAFSTVFSGSCAGWTSEVYKADTITQIPPATVTLSPFGGSEDIFVKLTIPTGAVTGTTCTATVNATAGGDSAAVTDATTVKDLLLYSDPGYLIERYIFPAGNSVYAKAYGVTSGISYRYRWFDSSNVLRRTSPDTVALGGLLPDTYDIPLAGPLGTWRVEVRRVSDNALFSQVIFYVGPDHLLATYSGANPLAINTNATIDISLHDRYNHVVPLDPATGNVVQGNPPATKDPLLITVTVSGSATIVSTTLAGAVIIGQTVTGRLSSVTGAATITISDNIRELVTVKPTSYNWALYGSPVRDESTTVSFIDLRMRVLDWREIY